MLVTITRAPGFRRPPMKAALVALAVAMLGLPLFATPEQHRAEVKAAEALVARSARALDLAEREHCQISWSGPVSST